MNSISDDEEIARLLFFPQMFKEGKLTPQAFPTDELARINGKDGVSTDRCNLLDGAFETLSLKATYIASPEKGREKFGYCQTIACQIRKIESQKDEQVFEIYEDISDGQPEEWRYAHSLLYSSLGRAEARGYRDKLIEIFSKSILRIFRLNALFISIDQISKNLFPSPKLILDAHLHPHPIADGQWGIKCFDAQVLGRFVMVAPKVVQTVLMVQPDAEGWRKSLKWVLFSH